MEFLSLSDADLIVSHEKNNMHIEEIQEDEDGDEEGPDLGKICKTILPALPFPSAAVECQVDEQLYCVISFRICEGIWGGRLGVTGDQ